MLHRRISIISGQTLSQFHVPGPPSSTTRCDRARFLSSCPDLQSQALRLQERLDDIIRPRRVVVHIDAVARVRLNVRREVAGWHQWEVFGHCCRDRGERWVARCEAVASAKWQVIRWEDVSMLHLWHEGIDQKHSQPVMTRTGPA